MTPERQAEKVYADILAQMGKGGSAVQLQIIADAIRSAVAAEREAIAKMVEQDVNSCETCGLGGSPDYRAEYLAKEIRKRTTPLASATP